MSTQTSERVESIEHLDFTPECCASIHQGDRPRASYITDQHGCGGGPLCIACMKVGRQRFNEIVVLEGAVNCFACKQSFRVFEDCVQVTPL
ncbi:hypothetical protein [Nocardia flavorosea]|uniref:Uncharacterized protein n=1 Tax=Nocardia flavorosea TaxID=53429 RepID=A0A846YS61_9NOCA|nr:hypothetical protein [Nocardia flavorosea]NKY60390.1 hypothetical protein [Nocardia flavorosea]